MKRYITLLRNFRFLLDILLTGKRAGLLICIFVIIFSPMVQALELEKELPKSTTVILNWTATGDNGPFVDRASFYDIRYLPEPITNRNWDRAIKEENVPAPKDRGSAESYKVMELTPDTDYYFAIKVGDASGNWSVLSNVVMFRTASPPICGDLNESGVVEIADIVYLITYMFIDGLPRFNLNAIDLDSSGEINIADLITFINYMFSNGPPLECP